MAVRKESLVMLWSFEPICSLYSQLNYVPVVFSRLHGREHLSCYKYKQFQRHDHNQAEIEIVPNRMQLEYKEGNSISTQFSCLCEITFGHWNAERGIAFIWSNITSDLFGLLRPVEVHTNKAAVEATEIPSPVRLTLPANSWIRLLRI